MAAFCICWIKYEEIGSRLGDQLEAIEIILVRINDLQWLMTGEMKSKESTSDL